MSKQKQVGNKVLIMARSERQAYFLQNSLRNILMDKIDSKCYIYEIDPTDHLAAILAWQPNLIVTLDMMTYQLASQFFHIDNILPATLDVSEPQFLDRLLQLPRGKRILVVHKTEYSANEIIRSLISLGLDHLEYVPYWKNCGIDFGEIDTAISTVSLEYTPPHIEHKIDLGFRRLSISSFVEILKRLELNIGYVDQYANQERRTLITPHKEQCGENSRNKDVISKQTDNLGRRNNNTRYTFNEIITANVHMEQLIIHAQKLAATNLPILISGESGTGKEMFAQAIHNHSPRAAKPFVAINFAALPENLIESELFGYEEGAFTGARRFGKKGLFELAHMGTVFLDEIGDASMAAQTRLLRILEEKELMRVGGIKIIPIDIRVISATNKDLKKAILSGCFREDLYYRLCGFQLALPSLREQRNSIVKIIETLHILQSVSKSFASEALSCILNYSWKGNMRELKNTLEYLAQTVTGTVIELTDLPSYLSEQQHPNDNDVIEQDINLLSDLSNQCELTQVKIILQTLKDNQKYGKTTGRNKIIEAINSSGYTITENRVKNILKILEGYSLIKIGTTKQGSEISVHGERFLQSL